MEENQTSQTNQTKQVRWIWCIVAWNVILTIGICVLLAQYMKVSRSTDDSSVNQYTLYIGTNDKDTYTQLIPLDEARDIVNEICTKYVEGYTASEATGGWVDQTGTLTQENTLVYSFYDTTEEQMKLIMDDVLKELNQNSILIERAHSDYEYYSHE